MKTKSLQMFFLGWVLVSATPQSNAFTYQGRLLSNGAAAEGLFDVRFALFTAETNGTTTAGPVTNLNVIVTNGLFTTLLDFGTNIYDGAPYWLDMAIRPSGSVDAFTTLAPRQALTPTPYSLHTLRAKLADKAKAVEPAAVDTAALADASVTEAKLVNRGITSAKLAIGAVTANELSGDAVTTDKIADGSIVANDLNLDLLGMTFWRLGGNAGTTPGTHFLGTTDNQPLEFKVNGQRALRLEDNGDGTDPDAFPDGAPNVLGGSHGNYISPGTVGATIAGGGATNSSGLSRTNSIRSDFGTIGGGLANRILSSSTASTIAGGLLNRIGTNAQYAVISGGANNSISTNSHYAIVAGGFLNDIGSNAANSVISGGWDNNIAADARSAAIAGGILNNIGTNSSYSAIGGGNNNVVQDFAQYAIIPGGIQNAATTRAFAAGTRAKANHPGAFVWADSQNADFPSTSNDQFNVRASGGVRFETSGAGAAVDGQPVIAGLVNVAHLADGAVTAAKLAANSVTSASIANGAVNTAQLADGAVTAAKMAVVTNWFALTIPNPTPASLDYFGSSIATVGSDRLLIGASSDDTGAADTGTAYLFNLSGTLLTTFTNPSPATGDNFGYSVAALGSDRVLIGAYLDNTGATDAGAAYLFSTNGTLLTTFTNPTPAASDLFGWSVIAVGNDRVLISALQDDMGATDTGAAYLFSTNGTLLTTITNPTPANGDWFGVSVAVVGSDRVLVSATQDDTGAADAGTVYLFRTNGTLLTTITNPTPAASDRFGYSMAVIANDRVIISAYSDDTGAFDSGSAYLFSTNGTLLTTFTNPTPASSDNFGYSVAALGNDRVLIGASQDDTGAFDSGSVYLFNTNGTLLTTFTNPTPAANDLFGSSVVAVGNDRMLIGAYQDDTGANDAGAAYLFTAETFVNGLVASDVRHGGITTGSLADGVITSAKIATGAVGSAQIVNGAVNTAQLADGAVTAAELAANSVTSTAIANGAVNTAQLAEDAVTAAKVVTASNWFALTIANPTPAIFDLFGRSVAAVGTNWLLIGAPVDDTGASQAGAAYLFSTTGALLTTFNNPTPEDGDNFGISVAAVGSDRVLIGAYFDNTGAGGAGAAYLFGINGALLTTFTNPAPAVVDHFGFSVSAVGTAQMLIGAPDDDTGALNAGAAYLFSTNGALLATFTNPTPANQENFGTSVAAVGTDRVLIGAPNDNTGALDAGATYLFSTNGALLTTFTNPTPAANDWFGISVAAVGSDRVLIGAYLDNTGATDAGAAYLFSTNGAWLTTFTNPTPAVADHFGYSVAAVGTDRVLIGAFDNDAGASPVGEVYLFSTNGALLTTFSNPTPAFNDRFGRSVAAVGTDRVLIGAYFDDTGAEDAGAAYLFSLETFTPGLVADGVSGRSITTASLEDGAVTAEKLSSTIGVWMRDGDDVFRLTGNVGIGTNSPTQKLVVAGNIYATGAITPNSDRNLKTGFESVDAAAILEKVSQLPIQQWRFKTETEDVKHIGPMAQDFRAAFSLGEIPTAIATVDADGVALAAIQGLNKKLEGELQARDMEIGELRNAVSELKKLVQRLAAQRTEER